MNIDIYSKYKVRFLNSGAYISQEDSTPNDIAFTHYEDYKEEIIDGGKLLEIIRHRLDDAYLQELSVINNIIRIEIFNYMNGENDKYIMVIERYLGNKEE